MLNFMMIGSNAKSSVDLSFYYKKIPNYRNITALPAETLDYLSNVDKASAINNMFGLNRGDACNKLKTIPPFAFKTAKCTSVSRMFCGCYGLQDLDINWLDTVNCTDMSYMFSGCSALSSLNVSGLNTRKCTNMSNMFYSCASLPTLDISGWDTSRCQNMDYTLSGCSKLTNIVGAFDMSNCTSCQNMFAWSDNLKGVHLKNVPRRLDMRNIGGEEGVTYIIDNYIQEVISLKKYVYKGKSYTSILQIKHLMPNVGIPDSVTDEQLAELGITAIDVEPSLDELKKAKLQALKLERDRKEIEPIAYNDKLYDYDDKARDRINAAIIALEAQGEKANIVWTLADNTSVVVTANDLRMVIANVAIRSNDLHVKYRKAKDKVNACQTVAELDKIILD